ncbi:MAG: hypothetical protein WGN25_06055 [Candidatus Electrothrix sp. GW3-4]|uniref:hypothetical protein n=1 Tax=Candidatus Electrothrix sp. GW3-4 TaxID=3126740 RepID=UPI0030CB860D
MSNLIWLVFIFLVVVLVGSLLWFIWRLRHFSQSHNQTVLDDKLMQTMLGDEALSKELKGALVGKKSTKYPPVSAADDEEKHGAPARKGDPEQQVTKKP